MMISPSILNSNERVKTTLELNKTNINYIHIDVMDGKFVKDTQFNKIKEIEAINLVSKYPLDVHLMVNNPIKYIEELENMNIEYITFHLEIKKDKKKIIEKIKSLGYKVGISIKPNTSIEDIIPYLKDIDMVLVMSVEPGLGGQKFMNTSVGRINKLKNIIRENEYNIKIEVDGGINDKNITKLENADIVVVGSYITKSENYAKQIETLHSFFKEDDKNINNKTTKKFKEILIIITIVLVLLVLIFLK